MKVLHVISTLETGGAQKFVGELLPLLNKKPDIDIKLLTFKSSGSDIEKNLKESGVEIVSLETPIHSLSLVSKLKPFLREADLVHAHLFPTNYFVAIANIGINKPLFFTEHSTHNRRRDHKWLRPIEKYIYNRYRKIVCISYATKTSLDKWLHYKPSNQKSIVIENGVDLSRFNRDIKVDSQKIFGRKGIPILMISRFTASKDHPTLLRAIKEIVNPEVFAVLVGDGELRPEIEKLARDLGIEDRVLFLGTRSDIPEIISAAKIGVQSSNWEGFGLTAVEMMAGGLPVIASNVEGLKQVVEGAGILFEKGDFKHLSELIKQLINNSELNSEIKQLQLNRVNAYKIERTVVNHISQYTGQKE